MANHKMIRSTLLVNFGGRFSQELWLVKCNKTDKTFELTANYNFNKELDKFDDPECSYSYCPHCAEKLDLKGDD
jgi:hypothetical protein